MSLVDRIKLAANKNGMTLASIEKSLGFGNSTIRKWDNNSPSLDKVIATANLLNVSISWLATGNIDETTKSLYIDFLNKYEKLTESDKIKIDHFIEICLMNLPESSDTDHTEEQIPLQSGKSIHTT